MGSLYIAIIMDPNILLCILLSVNNKFNCCIHFRKRDLRLRHKIVQYASKVSGLGL